MIEPAQADPLVATMSAAIGGPRGVHARGSVPWLPVGAVLIVLTTITFSVGMLQKAACAAAGWDSSRYLAIRYTHLCASDLPGAYKVHGLVDHPVLTTYWAAATAQVTRWIHDTTTMFMVVNGVGFALLAMVAALLLSRVRPGRPWDVAAFAVSPALLLTGLVSWDLLAVALVALALWAYARGDLGLTGVAIGLGASADIYPAFLVVPVVILAIRRREWLSGLVITATSVGAWLILNLPAMVTHPGAWRGFWSRLDHLLAGPGSIWVLLQDSTGSSISSGTLNLCMAVVFMGLLVGIVTLGLLSPREPSFAQLAFLTVLAVVLVDKVYAPQYVLWLLPLAVLAHPRWRDQLLWQGAEVLYFCATAWNLAGLMSSGDGPAAMYDIAIAIRLLAEVGLAGAVAYDVLKPQTMTVSSNVVVV